MFKTHDCDRHKLHSLKKPISECRKTEVDYPRKGRGTIYHIDLWSSECVWHAYQKEAEEIIAPGGTLIADPKERNRAINAAYAKLWLHDNRFQWAGLAAFASKQVGCGLLHASTLLESLKAENEAAQKMTDATQRYGVPFKASYSLVDEDLKNRYLLARLNNPVPSLDLSPDGKPRIGLTQSLWDRRQVITSLAQRFINMGIEEQYQYVYEKLAMGNTALFLDVYPLHAFYKKRGQREFFKYLKNRKNIRQTQESETNPIYWPIKSEKPVFGWDHGAIYKSFQEIEDGDITESVKSLARHEQINILQPAMYDDYWLEFLLRGNHFSYVTDLPSGVAQAVELTLASQCSPVQDSRTIEFEKSPWANLADVDQRMPFVLKAAQQFDDLLRGPNRHLLNQAIGDIAEGKGVA